MRCPKCQHDKSIRNGYDIKGRPLKKCKVCGTSFIVPERDAKNRCECGLKKTECDGNHTNWIQYDELMGNEKYYLMRDGTQKFATPKG